MRDHCQPSSRQAERNPLQIRHLTQLAQRHAEVMAELNAKHRIDALATMNKLKR